MGVKDFCSNYIKILQVNITSISDYLSRFTQSQFNQIIINSVFRANSAWNNTKNLPDYR